MEQYNKLHFGSPIQCGIRPFQAEIACRVFCAMGLRCDLFALLQSKNNKCVKLLSFSCVSSWNQMLATKDQYVWSPRLKHPDIQISSLRIKRTAKTQQKDSEVWFACCLSNKPILNNLPCCWSLKILQLASSWMGLGICRLNQPLTSSFSSTGWNKANNGQYLIISYGRLSVNTGVGKMRTCFGFKAGDTICFELSDNRLRIGKGGDYAEVQVAGGEEYVVCVYLLGVGDEVEWVSG